MTCSDNAQDPCTCPEVFPLPVCNPSGLTSISYRIGDFVAFRNRLLLPLAGETELTAWRPDTPGDLAVQMMEWWAYLGDILTFYTERIANESYLRTAMLPESVNHLVQLLGYRPKPALGAKGNLAALLSPGARLPVTLPAGLQIQSKPPPGMQPQIFQVDEATPITAPDVISAVVSPVNQPLLPDTGTYVWLAGKVSGIKPAERILLINSAALTSQSVSLQDYSWISVVSTAPQSDPLGNPVTQVNFTTLSGTLQSGAQAANYVLLRPGQSSPLWSYPTPTTAVVARADSTTTTFNLAGTARSVTPGSLLLLDVSSSAAAATTLGAAFAAGFEAAAFVAAYAADTAGSFDATLEFDASLGPAVAAAFAAAYQSSKVTPGNAAQSFEVAINFANTYAKQFGTGAVAAAAAAFTAAFGPYIDAATGLSAFQSGFPGGLIGEGVTAQKITTAFAAGFTAAGAKLPNGFVAASSELAYAFDKAFIDALGSVTNTSVTNAATEAVAAVATLVPLPVIAETYSEIVWYANGDGPTPPSSPPPPAPVGIPSAQIGFASLDSTGRSADLWNFSLAQVTVRWGWTQIGQLVPVLTAADLTWTGGATALIPMPGAVSFPTLPVAVLLEDPSGNAASAAAMAAADPASGIVLTSVMPQPSPDLASPVSVFFNQVSVSRGKSVPAEVLGSGNPSVAGQDFTLQQSPVTYFFDPASVSGPNFTSTVDVSVNGVLWKEVQSFYGQPPNAQVYVLHEDDKAQTHVSFGDGVNGALLPTGAGNVVATYRYGAGAAAPPPETLTVVLTPTPGLKGVRNPLAPTGGGDADPPADLRQLAPESVLTFNRAVSLDDYAALAKTASGVTQAAANFVFDPLSQRPLVTLWIAGDSGAVAAATNVVTVTSMPNQGLIIRAATALTSTLSLTYVRDPRYADSDVRAGLTAALLDPDTGLLGMDVLGIGQPIYQSQIAAACLAVTGVEAIRDVTLAADSITIKLPIFKLIRRFGPTLQPLGCAGQGWSPGAGNYILVPNDGQHLVLTGAVAS